MKQRVIYSLMVYKMVYNITQKTVLTPVCLGNISKDFSVDNMKKTGLNEYVYDFSVDSDAIAVDDILNIHKYFMKKHDTK